MPFLGRDTERQEITTVIDRIREGFSASLVVRGEAGIGKTALLDDIAAACDPPRVLRLVAIESEMELGFAALHQLLLPFLDRLPLLPAPQRRALQSAFGLSDAQPADRFLVGLSCLSLLANAASDEGLLIIVDDAQWLDRESADALGFAARRLYADPVGFLFGVRDPDPTTIRFDGLAEIRLSGLNSADARSLFVATAPNRVDEQTLQRILGECRGNPLALVEFASGLVPGNIAGGSLMLEPAPLRRQLETMFLETVESLPPVTQTLLLLAATETTGDPSMLWRASDVLGIPQDAVNPAEKASLLSIGTTVTFRHPLIRSAVYHGSTAADRRKVHAALAAVMDPANDADRRAWHLAASVVEVDASVADDLERAAGRAKARGGYSATAAFLTRAAELTPDPPTRVRRLLSAAEATVTTGEPAAAQHLLELAAGNITEPLDRARAELVHGMVLYASGQESTAAFLKAAREFVAGGDVHAARNTLLEALVASFVNGEFASPSANVATVAAVIRTTPLPPDYPATVGDQLLDALAALHDGSPEDAASLLLPATEELLNDNLLSDDTLRWLFHAANAAGVVGDVELVYRLSTKLLRLARENGAAVTLTRALHNAGVAEVVLGSLDAALATAEAGYGLVSGQEDVVNLGEIMVSAWRGLEDQTRQQARAGFLYAHERRQGWLLVYLHYAMEVLELGLGNYKAAKEQASSLIAQRLNIVSFVAVPDFIEAAMRSGAPTEAKMVLEQWTPYATACGTPFSAGLLAQCHALVDDDPSQYQLAIDQLEHTQASGAKARIRLLYGEWLRRANRPSDARVVLRQAHEVFVSMGSDHFAKRAEAELLATGERIGARSPRNRLELTPQELRVAQLAADRLTNAEIAAQLFISSATVDYHLRKVFRKLDIESRRQLNDALQRYQAV